MLSKSSIKWRQRPDMTFAVDLDVKHQFKQTNKNLSRLTDECLVTSIKNFLVLFLQKDLYVRVDFRHSLSRHIIEPVGEKTNTLGSDPVRHKPGCIVTEDG